MTCLLMLLFLLNKRPHTEVTEKLASHIQQAKHGKNCHGG
jgi:hypothetical protein